MLVVPTGSTFLGLLVLGLVDDDHFATQLFARGPLHQMDLFIRSMQEDPNFVIVETIKSSTTERVKGTYDIKLSKKGKFLKSNLQVSFEPEYTSGNVSIYSVKGKLDLVFTEEIAPGAMKMAALKKIALVKAASKQLPKFSTL